MKKLFALLFALIATLTACGRETADVEVEPPLEFNGSAIYGDDLAQYLQTLSQDDTVTVNIHLRSLDWDGLVIKQNIEKEHGIPVTVCNAIANRSYGKSDPYAREWYDSMIFDGEPTFDENVDQARLAYEKHYESLLAEARLEYYNGVVAEMPFKNPIALEENTYNVRQYTATAKELSELSFHERVSLIFPWTETPVEPPKSVKAETVLTKDFGDLTMSVIFDKKEYAYGDTVNVQISVYNGGSRTAYFKPICETGNNSVGDPDHKYGFYYLVTSFCADGEDRRDVSCCYGYDEATTDVKPTGILEPGETMSKTYAFTPHKSYRFLGEGVSEESEWTLKTVFDTVDETENWEYNFEVKIPRSGK